MFSDFERACNAASENCSKLTHFDSLTGLAISRLWRCLSWKQSLERAAEGRCPWPSLYSTSTAFKGDQR